MKKSSQSVTRLIIIVAVYVVLDILTRLPYLNVFLKPWIVYFLLWTAVVVIYRISYRWTFLLAAISLLVASIALVTKRSYIAENIGNFVYLILLLGALQFFLSVLKDLRRR